MSMMDEIEKLMVDAGTSCNYRIINLGGNSLYIEGIKSVIYFGENEMQFQLKKCQIKVVGENLKVKYLDSTACVLIGKVKVVETL